MPSSVVPALQPNPPPTAFADNADLIERKIKRLRQRAAHGKRALARGPDGQVAIRHILRGAGVRLDRYMLHMRDVKAVVKDSIRLFKRFVRVAFPEHVVVGDVRAGFRVEDRKHFIRAKIGVNDRCIRLHAFQRVGDGGQHFILYLDEFAGAARDLRRVRGDGGDRFAAITRLADRDKVLVFQIKSRAALVAFTRDHAAHAREGFCRGKID